MVRRTASALLVTSLVASLGLTASRVAAQSPVASAGPVASAEVLFEEGKRLMDAGKYVEACPKLAESQRLEPGAGTLLNLGACYEKLGLTASAWVTYREAVSVADTSQRKAWAAQAQKRATAIEPTLSKLTITVATPSEGLSVKRDGQPVREAEWGVAVPLDPGAHLIEATAPGRRPFSTSVEVTSPGSSLDVTVPALEVEPPPVVAPPPPPPRAAPTPRSILPTVGLGVAGLGLVGLGLGTYFGLAASSTFDDAKSRCSADLTACETRGLHDVRTARDQATLSTLGCVAGGALLAGGVVLFLTTRGRSSPARSGSGSTTPLQVSPILGAAHGLALGSVF